MSCGERTDTFYLRNKRDTSEESSNFTELVQCGSDNDYVATNVQAIFSIYLCSHQYHQLNLTKLLAAISQN